ncbi:MAG: hypothetical protein ACOC1K_07325 [Nanoarchaeota archaeon]
MITTKRKIFTLIILIIVLLLLSGCESILENSNENSATVDITGSLITENGDEKVKTDGLIVLKNDNEEVDRTYKDIDKDKFQFENIPLGNYTLEIHRLGSETIIEEISIAEEENISLGEFVVNLEQPVEEDEKNLLYFIGINTNDSPLDDEKIRLALNYALDKNHLANEAKMVLENENEEKVFEVERAKRVAPPSVAGYENTVDINLEQDQTEAENLIVNSRYENSEIDFYYSEDNYLHSHLKDEIKDFVDNLEGLSINLVEDSFENIVSNQESVYMFGNRYDRNPVAPYENFLDLDNESKDLLEKAKMNMDDKEKSLEYVLELEKKLINDGRIIPLYHYSSYEK